MNSWWNLFWERYRNGLTLGLLGLTFATKFLGGVALGMLLPEWIVQPERSLLVSTLIMGAPLLIWASCVYRIWRPSGWMIATGILLSAIEIAIGFLAVWMIFQSYRSMEMPGEKFGEVITITFCIAFILLAVIGITDYARSKVMRRIGAVLWVPLLLGGLANAVAVVAVGENIFMLRNRPGPPIYKPHCVQALLEATV